MAVGGNQMGPGGPGGDSYDPNKMDPVITKPFGSGYTAVSNLISNTGVVGADVSGVGTARDSLNSCSYGGDKGIFCFGYSSGGLGNITNLVSNAGVVATDVSGIGTARQHMGACEYSAGQDKAILAFGDDGSLTAVSNLISNVGVVAADVTGVGTVRTGLGSMPVSWARRCV